ncbi:hypothetical protein [uncultured Clostridium sp.]|uniref:hypothetical protein n=1 Tax=uncultured Clostridium sp. TaxID=59620 RepID=UPI002635ACF9|nr:hypothetical protein [uncultured Clostridium sp.]
MSKTIEANIPILESGQKIVISNIDGNYIASEFELHQGQFDDYLQLAEYDVEKLSHLYDRLLTKDNNEYVTTPEQICSLAKNTQTNLEKVIKINGIIQYYLNKSDLIGKTYEILENNINTNFTINYPLVSETKKSSKKKEAKMKDDIKSLINKFNSDIELKKLIVDNVMSVYTEGNFVMYLKGDSDNGYGVVKYPLDITEITDRTIDGEPLVVFNVNELKSRLQGSINKYGKMKTKQKVDIKTIIHEEVKRDYPEEVYEAYKNNDSYVYLNPERIGVNRINNMGKKYGVTPLFKALTPLLTLETIDNVDRKNLQAKAKKVFYQKMRKECIDSNGQIDINAVGYAQASLLQAMDSDVVIYTSTGLVESLEILEPKADPTDNDIVSSNRNRVLGACGITFSSNESKNGANVVKINYEDLLKTINKINRGLERILNKLYKVILDENGFPSEYAPTINIQNTLLLDLDSCSKLVDLVYSKIGLSYKTAIEALGLDYDEEVSRRKAENDNKFDEEIFIPHGNSYTSNSNQLIDNINLNKNSNGSKKSENQDKSLEDKVNNDVKV